MQPYLKFCKRCGCDSERYADGRCKACTLSRNAVWAAQNKEKWREARREASRRWVANNPKKRQEVAANYRAANKDAINERRALARKQNPNLERVKTAKRRARIHENGGTLSKDIVATLLIKQGHKCACCGRSLSGSFHLDHIIPLSRGGPNSDANVQLLLPECNLQKYNRTPDEFFVRKQSLC